MENSKNNSKGILVVTIILAVALIATGSYIAYTEFFANKKASNDRITNEEKSEISLVRLDSFGDNDFIGIKPDGSVVTIMSDVYDGDVGYVYDKYENYLYYLNKDKYIYRKDLINLDKNSQKVIKINEKLANVTSLQIHDGKAYICTNEHENNLIIYDLRTGVREQLPIAVYIGVVFGKGNTLYYKDGPFSNNIYYYSNGKSVKLSTGAIVYSSDRVLIYGSYSVKNNQMTDYNYTVLDLNTNNKTEYKKDLSNAFEYNNSVYAFDRLKLKKYEKGSSVDIYDFSDLITNSIGVSQSISLGNDNVLIELFDEDGGVDGTNWYMLNLKTNILEKYNSEYRNLL